MVHAQCRSAARASHGLWDCAMVELPVSWTKMQRSIARSKWSRRKFLTAGLLGLPLSTAAYGRWCEPFWLTTCRIRIGPQPAGHQLVHFTDLHHKGDRAYLQKVVRTINELQPQFVCFTGDLIEEAEHLGEALELLGEIRAPLYGVPGNHDYWAEIDFTPVAECFASTGGKWLMDEAVLTRDGSVNIIGVTCGKAPAVQPISRLKNILLFHYPDWVTKLSGVRFDLMLAGHSHGGQVRLPFYGPLLLPSGVGEYDMGLFQTAVGPLYVNPGIGYFYANVRFCCRPEVTLVEF